MGSLGVFPNVLTYACLDSKAFLGLPQTGFLRRSIS
ncbi:uncharacterized protein G2W53_034993 [Senna tora]|uniref:Uncharacterized protein n=1 Tax=Senna tora TaxID=362788 RepID=A0A834W3Q0_9FABA|nr:uncharacterized protein G2W53_034993 [Senna tora]